MIHHVFTHVYNVHFDKNNVTLFCVDLVFLPKINPGSNQENTLLKKHQL